MPAASGYSVASLFQYPYIVDRISRVGATSLAFSNFYRQGISVNGRDGQLISGNDRSDLYEIVFDIFNNTRLTSSARAQGTGPMTVNPQKSGQVTANGMRFYENRLLTISQIDKFRRLGSNRTDQLDTMGQEYMTRQLDDLIRRAVNGREFSFVNMLKGGFKVMRVGSEQWIPVPSSYSNNIIWTNDYKVPANHKTQIALGSGGANLISASWATSTTDIVGDLRNIRAAAVEQSGLPITEMWCNSKVFNYIVNNEKAQSQGGVSFRVWDRLTQQTVTQGSPTASDMGSKYILDVTLRALPEITIHVYDDGLTLPSDSASVSIPEDQVPHDPAVSGNETFVKFLGDTEVLLTPPPSMANEWLKMYAIKEVIKKNYQSPFETVYGMAAWVREQIDPVPAYDLRVLDNYCPALIVPTAVYNPTVVF